MASLLERRASTARRGAGAPAASEADVACPDAASADAAAAEPAADPATSNAAVSDAAVSDAVVSDAAGSLGAVADAASPPASDAADPDRVRPRALPELALVVALFLVYKVGRVIADGHVGRAFADERRVWRLERWLHLPNEAAVQHGLLASDTLVHVANAYYAWVHFPVSGAFLIWIYAYRPAHYVPLRRLMALVTALSLVVHISFPLAPPRMIADIGMIDTAAVFGPSVYGSPATDTLSNQYAAMPSLHVGWALIIAVGLIIATRTRWRWLWLLYPIVTFAVVVGTANHYWLDGLVIIVIIAAIAPWPGVLGWRKPAAVEPAAPQVALERS